MNRFLLVAFLTMIANWGLAQKAKDAFIKDLPMVDGKLIYEGKVQVNGHQYRTLDSVAKKWFNSYFIDHQECTPPQGKDTASSVLSLGLLQFQVSPNNMQVIKYNFLLQVTMKIDCKDNYYSYKISEIRFRQKSGFMNVVLGFPGTPEYYIKLSQKKHLGIMDYSRATIRNYLSNLDLAIQSCIASLNKAMAN